jgi:phosphoglycerate kinase
MNKRTIRDIEVSGKTILVRVDLNVPIDKNKKITDETRICEVLPTINYLTQKGARVILCSHLGRPKGEFNKEFSLKPVADRLNVLFKDRVTFASDTIGESAKRAVTACKDGHIVLLENLRFHQEEEDNDAQFCKSLASLCDIYVNDAFGASHREHASTSGISKFVKDCAAGFLLEKEVKILNDVLENPKHPFVAILGGSKVSDKIGVISNLLDKVDTLLIGGAMAFTFVKSAGGSIGKSRCEEDKLELARQMVEKAKRTRVKLIYSADAVCAREISENARTITVDAGKIPDGYMGLDIGPKTIRLFTDEISNAGTVIWNGPAGVFEIEQFSSGTRAIADAMSKCRATTVIGGGDSAAAAAQMGYKDKMSHISTGGGASLRILEGETLPGVDCLNDK